MANQAKKDPGVIIGKKTDKIAEFDPNAKQEVSDSKVRADDPVLAPLQAYGPMVEQISKMEVEHAVELYNASEGHYPKDHEEFMTRVIKPNNIKREIRKCASPAIIAESGTNSRGMRTRFTNPAALDSELAALVRPMLKKVHGSSAASTKAG